MQATFSYFGHQSLRRLSSGDIKSGFTQSISLELSIHIIPASLENICERTRERLSTVIRRVVARCSARCYPPPCAFFHCRRPAPPAADGCRRCCCCSCRRRKCRDDLATRLRQQIRSCTGCVDAAVRPQRPQRVA